MLSQNINVIPTFSNYQINCANNDEISSYEDTLWNVLLAMASIKLCCVDKASITCTQVLLLCSLIHWHKI